MDVPTDRHDSSVILLYAQGHTLNFLLCSLKGISFKGIQRSFYILVLFCKVISDMEEIVHCRNFFKSDCFACPRTNYEYKLFHFRPICLSS